MNIKSVIVLALGLFSATIFAQAATIGYWSFENDPGFLNDSAGSNDLTNNSGVTQVATPFGSPVPQTGVANEYAASFNGSNYLSRPDNPSFNVGSVFTIEAFIRSNGFGATHVIAAQYDSEGTSTGQRSWFFGTTNANQLRLSLSSGNNNVSTDSQFTSGLAADTNYYVAAVYNAGNIEFYMKDLSESSNPLLSETRTSSITSVRNATTDFTIGALVNANSSGGVNQAFFDGIIDEVRLSSTGLSEDQLLVVIPESGMIILVVMAGIGTVLIHRRRRA